MSATAELPAPSLVLTFADAPVERRIVSEWLNGTPWVDPASLEQALSEAKDDPWVVPVRVAWLPPERNGSRSASLRDLVALSKPPPSGQARPGADPA